MSKPKPTRHPLGLKAIFLGFLSDLLAWGNYRFSRLPYWKQVVLVIFFGIFQK